MSPDGIKAPAAQAKSLPDPTSQQGAGLIGGGLTLLTAGMRAS
jgi:hypothetical protein